MVVRFCVSTPWRYSATSRARASFSTTWSWSPADGVPDMPSTSTGIDGSGLLDLATLVVDQRADLAALRADHEDVADLAACRG